MIRLLSALLTVSLAWGCAPEGELAASGDDAIVDGTRETGEPAVVLLMLVGGVGQCTGTLVSERVVLTAKHCVQGQGADSVYPPSLITVGVGSQFGATENWRVARMYATPGAYTSDPLRGLDATLIGSDVGVIVLRPNEAGQYPDVEPIPVRREPPNELVGQEFTAVGFGRTPAGTSGIKFSRTSRVDRLMAGVLYTSRTICSGDSGGPMIHEGPDGREVFGVASFGEADACPSRQDGYNAVHGFLHLVDAAMIAAGECPATGDEVCDGIDNDCDGSIDETCAGLGEPCAESTDCAFAQLPEPFDPVPDPVTCQDTAAGRVCTRPCDGARPRSSCSTVEVPLTGETLELEGVYCAREPGGCGGTCLRGSPGSMPAGSACAADLDCASLSCIDAGDGVPTCRTPCTGDAGSCPDGEVCPITGGGCSGCVSEDVLAAMRGVGERCAADGDCRSGTCFVDGDARYCSTACAQTTDCATGFHCRGGTCARGAPGLLGDPCSVDSDCASGSRCVHEGDRSYCSRGCDPVVCPEGFTCTEIGGETVCAPDRGVVGDACAADGDCHSGLCRAIGDGLACTAPCPLATDCPNGFECRRVEGSPICVDPATRRPSVDGGGGGGCHAGGAGSHSAAFGWLGAILLMVRRRPRRHRRA